jgi:hypothetical protein
VIPLFLLNYSIVRQFGAPRTPIVEPSIDLRSNLVSTPQPIDNISYFSFGSSFAVQDDLTILLHPTRTEAVVGGRKIVVTRKTRTLSGPLAKLRQKIAEMTEEGFRATAYPFFSKGRNRIKVEAKSGRVHGKYVWKRTRIVDTEAEAIAYLSEIKKLV